MATSVTEICNSALLKLGAKRISDIDDDAVNARACRDCYERLRNAELRKHIWNFAIARATLPAESAAPEWGRARAYQLPSDFLRLAPDYEEDTYLEKDWVIEAKFIYSDDVSPLRIRYIKRVADTTTFDPLFDEALASKMADEMAEALTQSNTKKAAAATDYKEAIAEAKRVNGIEKRPQVAPPSEWISRRF